MHFFCIFCIRVNKNRVYVFYNKNRVEFNVKFIKRKSIIFLRKRRFEIFLRIDEDKLEFLVVIPFNILGLFEFGLFLSL